MRIATKKQPAAASARSSSRSNDLQLDREDDFGVVAGEPGVERRAEEIGGEALGEGVGFGFFLRGVVDERLEQGADGAAGLGFAKGAESAAGAEVEDFAIGIGVAAEIVNEVLKIAAMDDQNADPVAVCFSITPASCFMNLRRSSSRTETKSSSN